FCFAGPDRAGVVQAVEQLLKGLEYPEHIDVAQLAWSLHAEQRKSKSDPGAAAGCRLVLLAASAADLKHKLELALKLLAGSETEARHPQGLYYREGAAAAGSVCFLFPGQGAQRINMLRDLVSMLPALHGFFEQADALLADRLPQALSRFIYPVPVFSDEARTRQQIALNATQVAQPALGVVEVAALEVLKSYGIAPDFVAGHSYGEYVALHAAGVIPTDDFLRLSEIRGRLSAEASECSPGSMAAVDLDEAGVKALVERHSLDVSLANLNAPDQTIIAGSIEAIDAAAAMLGKESVRVTKLPVTAAFHSPAMQSACEPLAAALAGIEFRPGRIPVFSNTTTQPYPESADEQRALLVSHFTQPVRFVEEIEHLYEAGARVFVEVGPGLVLSGLVDRILGERSHAALGMDVAGRSGWLQLAHVLGQLYSLGLPVDFGTWFKGRGYEEQPVAEVFSRARARAVPGPMIWRVNGGRALPWNAPRADAHKPASAVPIQLAAPAPTQAAVADSHAHKAAAEPARSRSFTPHERSNMANESTLRSADPPQEFTCPSAAHVSQVQNVIGQFIALQRDQQETMRQLLAFESRLVGVELPGLTETPNVSALPRLAHPAPVPAAARAEQAAAPAPLFVAPAPVLPAQVVALRAAAAP
ncbi:MAG: ACP S-malonyltransferase, partial [Zoogloea sp.]|nr:ACP S-malonyltransferase [Zoogloea sp.]